jgi:hypothetical protein
MAEKDSKKTEFVVKDRRLFSSDGELRQDVVEAEERERAASEAQQKAVAQAAEPPKPKPDTASPELDVDAEGPTAEEQKAGADAYAASAQKMDYRIKKELDKQGKGSQARDLEMTLEKFIASLYMTALMQLGMAAPQGEKPMLDLIGARQTIDVLGILNDKTKGNLTSAEESTLRNVLYELRMAYLEVTNLIANPPQDGVSPAN